LTFTDPDDPAAGFSGTVLEPGGTPSPNATVRGISGTGRGGGIFFAASDETGRFESGRARSDLPETFQVAAVNGGRTGIVTTVAGQPEATVQLQPAATLNGHLTSGPVDQFRVDLSIASTSPFGSGQGSGQSLQFTGDHFQLREVPGTAVHVGVSTQDGRSASQDVTLAPGGTADIEVPLQPLSTVSGKLLDSVTQLPVGQVTIFVDQLSQNGSPTASAPDGTFTLQASSGSHKLRGFAPNYQQLAQTFTAEAGQPVQLGTVAMVRQTAPSGTIGVTLRGTPPVVSQVIAQSPAELAGLHVGDQIAAIDGQAVTSVTDATARIPGAPGTVVSLTIVRSGSTLTIAVTRAS
jgi:hypothetical protein